MKRHTCGGPEPGATPGDLQRLPTQGTQGPPLRETLSLALNLSPNPKQVSVLVQSLRPHLLPEGHPDPAQPCREPDTHGRSWRTPETCGDASVTRRLRGEGSMGSGNPSACSPGPWRPLSSRLSRRHTQWRCRERAAQADLPIPVLLLTEGWFPTHSFPF